MEEVSTYLSWLAFVVSFCVRLFLSLRQRVQHLVKLSFKVNEFVELAVAMRIAHDKNCYCRWGICMTLLFIKQMTVKALKNMSAQAQTGSRRRSFFPSVARFTANFLTELSRRNAEELGQGTAHVWCNWSLERNRRKLARTLVVFTRREFSRLFDWISSRRQLASENWSPTVRAWRSWQIEVACFNLLYSWVFSLSTWLVLLFGSPIGHQEPHHHWHANMIANLFRATTSIDTRRFTFFNLYDFVRS